MFGKNEISKMPDFITDYDLWDKYMGEVWGKIFEFLEFDPKSTVIDLASGASAKIEYALANAGFRGTLFLVEPQENVAKIILQKAKKILPAANIVAVTEKFDKVCLKQPISAIFANHPFDDFLSAHLIQQKSDFNQMFDDISKEEESALNLLKKCWMAPHCDIEIAKQNVKLQFEDFLKRLDPDFMVFSQYPSSYFEKNGLDIINSHAKALFFEIASSIKNTISSEKIQKIMDENENYGNIVIGNNILDAKNWVAYAKSKK